MKETGELLKAKRNEKDLSLRQVSEALKISVRVLQAIEDDNPKHLPPRVFLRGFVQSYAAYLQIDVDQILEVFHREEEQSLAPATPVPPPAANVTESEVISEPPAPAPPKPPKTKKSQKKRAVWAMDYRKWSFASKAFAFLIVAVLVALIVFVAQMVEKYEKESIVERKDEIAVPPLSHEPEDSGFVSSLDGDEAKEAPTAETATDETAATAEESTTIEATTSESQAGSTAETVKPPDVEATSQQTQVVAPKKEEPKPKESAPAAETKPAEPAPAEQTAEKKPEEKPKEEAAKPAEVPEPPAEKPPVSAGSQEVIVEAFDKVQVTYSLDGEKKQTVTLNPGDLHTLKADSKIQVQVDNGGAINVFHNGKDRGVPGKIGKSLNMTFP